MHEFGVVASALETVLSYAHKANAARINTVTLTVGDMTETDPEALAFAYEVLTKDTLAQGSTLEVRAVHPRSRCAECLVEFDHDRFHVRCPECDSPLTMLLQGKELEVTSIDIEVPDECEGISHE